MAWIYIMANRKFGVTYVGATTDLIRRAWEHKTNAVPSFTSTHQCHLLVYFEEHQSINLAMQREHNVKHWVRAWKDQLIEDFNPEWDDLYPGIAPG